MLSALMLLQSERFEDTKGVIKNSQWKKRDKAMFKRKTYKREK